MPISRRDFLKTSTITATWLALSSCSPQKTETPALVAMPLPTALPLQTPQPVQPASGAILPTLRRITYGPTPEMLEKARRLGLDAFLDEQFAPELIPDDETDTLLSGFSTLKMTAAERLALDKKILPAQELAAATLLRQWHSQRQVFEMMVEFWSNHFSVYIGKSLCKALKTDDDQQTIRPNALGRFRDILNASAHSPAMLVFLDNAESRAGAPNENYARELLELHTLGVDGGYSQDDVQQTARILTGWTIAGQHSLKISPGSFVFNPRLHEPGAKTVLGKAIAESGEQEGNLLLDLLAGQPATSRFISTKLVRRFVSDDPSPSLVGTLSDTFISSGGDTRQLMRVLLGSNEFLSSAGQKVKRPLEFFISTLRMTGASFSKRPQKLLDHLRDLGQTPFSWPTPDGFPDRAPYWVTSSGLLSRWNFATQLVSGQIDGVNVDLKKLTRDAGSPADNVDVLSIRFLGEKLPDDARDILVDFSTSADPDKNLATLAALILSSPHFQVR